VAVFTLQLLGFEVDFINTVQYSNHTGYPYFKGQKLLPEQLLEIYEGLRLNNLNNYSYLLTGYMASEHTLKAIMTILSDIKLKNPQLKYICDPVMGDNGELYPSVPPEMIDIYKLHVLKNADIILPNQTECELLSGIKVNSMDSASSVIDYFHGLGIETVILKGLRNVDENPSKIVVLVSQKNKLDNRWKKYKIVFDRIEGHFTGAGDLFSAMVLAWSSKENIGVAVHKTVSAMLKILGDSVHTPNNELPLISNQSTITNPTIVGELIELQ